MHVKFSYRAFSRGPTVLCHGVALSESLHDSFTDGQSLLKVAEGM